MSSNIESKCWKCRKPYMGFKNEISMREYKITRLCQACQDEVFGEDNEPIANAKCPNCGELFRNEGQFSGVCSEKCGEQYSAYLNSFIER